MKVVRNSEQKTLKLRLSRETVRSLSGQDLIPAAGGATVICTEFCLSRSLCHC